MKTINLEKISEHLSALFIALSSIGVIALFFIQISFLLAISIFVYLGWLLLCALLYAVANHFKHKNSTEFDFYKVAEPLGRQERRKKQNIEERVAIHIDEDGLDPMVLFNEEKSGVESIITLSHVNESDQLSVLLGELNVDIEQQGTPIAGQTLMEISYQQEIGYYRVSEGYEAIQADFAFPEKTGALYEQASTAIKRLLSEHPAIKVTKINVTNYQAMQKFYHYVKRLSAPENRSVDYLSYCQGTLKICNTSYVELYDCTLQSTLTSWINQDGLIRTDNVDADLSGGNILQLMDIELPYPACRLIDIQIVNPELTQENAVKLYFTLAELVDDELTDRVSGLSLIMKDASISIKRDEQFDDELLSVEAYFKQKSYPAF